MKNNRRRGFFKKAAAFLGLGSIVGSLSATTNMASNVEFNPLVSGNPFLGQISIFPYNFAPEGWAKCDGQLLSIAGNSALFSLLGTIYGGDGEITFALPDLRGRCPINYGQGPGLSNRQIGQKSGTEQSFLSVNNLPSHTHSASVSGNIQVPVSNQTAETDDPNGAFLTMQDEDSYSNNPSAGRFLGNTNNDLSVSVNATGSGTGVNNMQPYLAIGYYISLVGIYPSPE